MSYVIYVATDSKYKGSYNRYGLRLWRIHVATDGKSEGSYNIKRCIPRSLQIATDGKYKGGHNGKEHKRNLKVLLLIVNQRVVTTDCLRREY